MLHLKRRHLLFLSLSIIISSCAMTSGVMNTGNGTYMISAHASAARGGATGANALAYQDAQKFCAQKGAGLHAIVINARERDVYQSASGGSWSSGGGAFSKGRFAAGNVDLYFRCGTQ